MLISKYYLCCISSNPTCNEVTGLHSKIADMLSDAVPTDTPVLHPESPLSHDDRFAEILKGLKDIGHHHALAHLSKPDTDDAKSEEDEEGPKKPKVPKGKAPIGSNFAGDT